jgi:hypothetical protein
MGRQQAPLYYTADLHTRGAKVNGVPILAAHVGEGGGSEWETGRIGNFSQFKRVFERIDPTVMAYIAVPQIWAGTFTPGIEYDRIDINAWSKDGGYQTGRLGYETFREFSVKNASPIRWNDLPAPPRIQQDVLDKTLGFGLVQVIDLTLWVKGEVVVST